MWILLLVGKCAMDCNQPSGRPDGNSTFFVGTTDMSRRKVYCFHWDVPTAGYDPWLDTMYNLILQIL